MEVKIIKKYKDYTLLLNIMCNKICCGTNRNTAISTATISLLTCVGGTTQIVLGVSQSLIIGTGIIVALLLFSFIIVV